MNLSTNVLYSMQEVLDFENNVTKSVWVLAPDIALGPQKFKPIMIANMREKGIEYRYIVSDDSTVLDNLTEFVSELTHEGVISGFNLKILAKEIIESDITIYDPNTPEERAFILAPYETADQHYRLQGSALYRIKQRFSALWRISDEIILNGHLNIPIQSNIKERSFCSHAWNVGIRGAALDKFQQWEQLGRELIHKRANNMAIDDRQYLIQSLANLYSLNHDLCPPFSKIIFPDDLIGTIKIMIKETLTCHLGGAYSAAIGMCGKMLEASMRSYIENRSDDELDQNIGLGKLIRIVVERFGIDLDEGLKILVNFINQFRITGVHSKKGFEIPTYEQSSSVLYATYDTLRKLFDNQ